MKAINVRKLRIALFGKDKLPVNEKEIVYTDVPLYAYWGDQDLQARMDLILVPQVEATRRYWNGKLKHRSAHRLLAICTCGKRVPVGRLAQHKH